jgi:hypothetical protein
MAFIILSILIIAYVVFYILFLINFGLKKTRKYDLFLLIINAIVLFIAFIMWFGGLFKGVLVLNTFMLLLMLYFPSMVLLLIIRFRYIKRSDNDYIIKQIKIKQILVIVYVVLIILISLGIIIGIDMLLESLYYNDESFYRTITYYDY